MRIRQIKPGWWLDKELRRGLSAAAREFYIGLWCVSDDGGWLEWDVERIAAELYPYGVDADGTLFAGDPVDARESAVRVWSQQLSTLDPDHPHLVVHPCGHAQLPKLTDHQRFGGRPVYTVRDAHDRDCARKRAIARPGKVGKGNGKVGGAARDGAPGGAAGASLGLKATLGEFEDVIRPREAVT